MANHLDLEEQEQLDQLKHFWNTWGNVISMAALAVALALAGWNGYQYWQNRQAGQAAALLDTVEVAVASKDAARMEQAFSDMRSKFPGTAQAGIAGFDIAKAALQMGNMTLAKTVLAWVADNAGDEGYQALARLRLSAFLLEEKAYDEALKQLSGTFPPEFAALVADRKGDILTLQDKKQEAIQAYSLAYLSFPESVEYRRLVEIKLNALGVQPQALAQGNKTEGGK